MSSSGSPPVTVVPLEVVPVTLPPETPVSIKAGRIATFEPRGRPVRVERRGARPMNASAPLIQTVGHIYRIDPALLSAVVHRESRGRVGAVSPKGALGLMQVMPSTARELGVRDPQQLRQDPVLALTTGAVYLKKMQARFGNDVPRVLAAYNAGPGAVQRYKGVPPYRETQNYVRTIVHQYRAQLGAPSAR